MARPFNKIGKEELGNQPRTQIIEDGDFTNPGIPYRGKSIPIPKNLRNETRYSMGGIIHDVSNQSIGGKIMSNTMILNNIIEILSFMCTDCTLVQEKQNKEVEEKLENNLKRIIEHLEINRQNISTEVQEIKNLEKERYETFTAAQDKTLKFINEQGKNNLESFKLKDKLENFDSQKILLIENRLKTLEEQQQAILKTINDMKEEILTFLK